MTRLSSSVPRFTAARATGLFVLLGLLAIPAAGFAQTETIEYYGTDAIGSIRIVWDANGNMTARQDFTPFGEPVLQEGTALPKEGFVGNETDSETNQDYFHARMLEARTGRFTRTDPIEDGVANPQSWNRYAYGLNNPVSTTDAYGDDPPHPGCFSDTFCLPGWAVGPPSIPGDGCGEPSSFDRGVQAGCGQQGGQGTFTPPGVPVPPPTVPPPPPPPPCTVNCTPPKPECETGFISASNKAWQRSELGTGNLEAGFLIVQQNGGPTFYHGLDTTNQADMLSFRFIPGTQAVVHTHPNNMDHRPSIGDKNLSDAKGVNMYVISIDGLYEYQPHGNTVLLRSGLSWQKQCNQKQ